MNNPQTKDKLRMLDALKMGVGACKASNPAATPAGLSIVVLRLIKRNRASSAVTN
jgi:hypothetical protein